MFYFPKGKSQPIRVQRYYFSNEILDIVCFVKDDDILFMMR